MRHRIASRLYAGLLVVGMTATPAYAQYRPRPINEAPLAEKYIVEVAAGLWNPNPHMSITSESLGIIGSKIDFATDLGLAQTRLKQLDVMLHPARKHKLRFEYIPLDYKQTSTLRRDIVFNGQRYNIGLPVISELNWKAYRFTYEYDFIAMNRGFGGLLLEAKQTDVTATLKSPVLNEYTRLRGPVPAVGGIARVYIVPTISISGELSGIKLPKTETLEFNGHYVDLDIYGTFDVTKNVGARFGYRSFDVEAALKDDSGSFTLKGLYFGVVARY